MDNGRRLIGQKVDVTVTSVIQTNAGKMIFAAAGDEEPTDLRARPPVRRDAPDAPVTSSTTVGQS